MMPFFTMLYFVEKSDLFEDVLLCMYLSCRFDCKMCAGWVVLMLEESVEEDVWFEEERVVVDMFKECRDNCDEECLCSCG